MNATKTEYVFFNKTENKDNLNNITGNKGNIVKQSKTLKILGIIVNKENNM